MRTLLGLHPIRLLLICTIFLLNGCAIQMIPPPASSPPAAQSVETATPTLAAEAAQSTPAPEQTPVETTETTGPKGALGIVPTPESFTIPEVDSTKLNVAFIFNGKVDTSIWSLAHNQGRLLVDQYLGDKVHTALVEGVAPEAVEGVLRQLAQKGFSVIFSTSFGYTDANQKVAAEFPNVKFIDVSGVRSNGKNFASLFGSMESMQYVAGMIAGARALEDGSRRVGYLTSFAFPETTRYVNASALGMRKTCPDCVMDVRWVFSFFDPAKERELSESMIDAGATVLLSNTDDTTMLDVVEARGVWGIGYNNPRSCEKHPQHCLTSAYWDWGQVYIWLLYKVIQDKFQGENYYFEVDSHGVELYGFDTLASPSSNIPADTRSEVKRTLNQMRRAGFSRFDIFSGEIKDNTGKIVVPKGASLTQSDLEGLKSVPNRPDCLICMNWLVEGVLPEISLPE